MPQAAVCIIGAGPAGLASAYYLQQAGIPYRLLEQAEGIGATWAQLYPSLRLNTTRFYSHLPGMRFPLRAGIFPTGRQYHAHLLRFAARHRIDAECGVRVLKVQREGAQWRVETNQGSASYAAVICASGIFAHPVWPQWPPTANVSLFRGQVMHAHEYHHPDQLKGRRVLVVGTGPSGVDIAVAASRVAAHTQLAIRSGIEMQRRYPYGLPKHVWLMLGGLLPKRWCNALQRLAKQGYRQAARYGLQRGQAVTAYQGPELLRAVQRGLVQPVAHPVAFEADAVHLADGTRSTPDLVVLATGYAPALADYLEVPLPQSDTFFSAGAPCATEIGPNGQRGWPLLDREQHPNGRQVVGQPGLYVVGVWYKGKGALYNINVEARIAAEQIAAQWGAG